jgi:hypothetical protein
MAKITDIFRTMFGFVLDPAEDEKQAREKENKAFALPSPDDGAVVVQSGAYYGTYVDLDGVVRNEIELVTKYRELAMYPEVESAVDDIINEAIVQEESGECVDVNCDGLEQPEQIRQKIRDEFDNILRLLNFNNLGHDIFKRWYIDGRLFYHVIIDEANRADGIQELRYIDPRRIRKVRQIEKTRDPNTGMELIKSEIEYYLYNERGIIGAHSNLGAKIAPDSVININSGLMDSRRSMVLSYLHKAIKSANQLRMLEDSMVIYRVSRAPERRVFYIDVGNMPTVKAEQYIKDIMNKHRNKIVYDATTGELRDDRRHLAMLEDFWFARREGNRGTEVITLPPGQSLGDIEDVRYFEKKLYKALGVPISRSEPNQGFTLGRSQEITRDELKFNKFVSRLRAKFSTLFDELMKVQLVLKNICTEDEWADFKEQIWYDFLQDNNFDELKKAELLQNRLGLLQVIDPYVGRYFSMSWVQREVLQFTEDEIQDMTAEMQGEAQHASQTMTNDPNQLGTGIPFDPYQQAISQQQQASHDNEMQAAQAEQDQQDQERARQDMIKQQQQQFSMQQDQNAMQMDMQKQQHAQQMDLKRQEAGVKIDLQKKLADHKVSQQARMDRQKTKPAGNRAKSKR